MAIVKMSEFRLLVMNTAEDKLLKSLQRFGDVTFADEIKAQQDGFNAVTSHYDFDDNQRKQEHIQALLKSLNDYQKKSRKNKKKLFEGIGIKNMTYDSLVVGHQQSNLDEILDMYAEFYESPHHPAVGYKSFIPWEIKTLSKDELMLLEGQNPRIGKVDIEEVERFVDELSNIAPIYYMYKIIGQEAIFVIIPPKGYEEAVAIIGEKVEIEKRSAVSLQIHDDVSAMQGLLAQHIEKRRKIAERIANIGHYQETLQIHYEYLRNEALREMMRLQFLKSEHVTYIEGWVATRDEAHFEQIIDAATNGIFDLEMNPAPLHALDVPIKLENNRFNSAFEPITSMYSQPRYDELDPTPLFAPFYAFFFGMMLADFGYGLVMGIIMFTALKLINFKPASRNMIQLLAYVSVPTMMWGLVYGSFFGGIIPLTPLIDINKDFNTVLVISIGFGVIHLFTGLAIKAYIYIRDYKKRYVLYDVIFWYMALIGVIILVSQLFTSALAAYSSIASIVMVIGMVGIVLTNGREAKTIPGKAASGLYSLYGMTNYIGDVVSYSRLMALGLAGASIGVAFNMMVELLAGMGVFGVIFGMFVFVFGHTFNLMISGLSSYVHSARLTYVEFFGKFFVGGGKAFEPFIAAPTYINIDRSEENGIV